MQTPETNSQTETPNRKPITRLTGGHDSFIRALASMEPYSRGWMLYYKHGLGFGTAYYRVAGADWVALGCGPTGYDEVRLSILAVLNGDGGIRPGIPSAAELAILSAPRPTPPAQATPTSLPSRWVKDLNNGYCGN